MSHIRSTVSIKSGIGLRELRAVLAVADLGSFRRAAAELGYTQSALSHQVAALEAALEWPLFHRPGGRGQVRLTPAGEAVCRRARRALGEVEAVPMLEDPWVILTRRDSELAELRRPAFDVLDGADLVAWTHRWQGQRELEQAWARRGIAPRIVYRTDDNLALQRLVAAGLGHACIGRLAARRAVDPSLTWLSPRDLLSHREIALCYPRQRQMTATARALVAAIRRQTVL